MKDISRLEQTTPDPTAVIRVVRWLRSMRPVPQPRSAYRPWTGDPDRNWPKEDR